MDVINKKYVRKKKRESTKGWIKEKKNGRIEKKKKRVNNEVNKICKIKMNIPRTFIFFFLYNIVILMLDNP